MDSICQLIHYVENRTFIIPALLWLLLFASSCGQKETVYDPSLIRFHLYGNGEPVFVLSGGPGNDCHQEEDVAMKIGEHYMAILLEQRGTGLSMPPELNKETINLEAYIKDLLFVMDSLKINAAKFYGHSWGAMLATYFATKYPEKVSALILTGPGYLKLDKSYQNKIFANRMRKLSPEQRIRFDELSKIDQQKLSIQEQNEISFLGTVFNTFDTTNWDWKYKKIQTKKNTNTNLLITEDLERVKFDITDKVGQLNMPITLITCKEDPLAFLTDEYIKFAPKSKVKWLDKCGHFPMYEKPQRFYSTLNEALSNLK